MSYKNYSQMWSLSDDLSDTQLQEEISRYEKTLKDLFPKKQKYIQNCSFFESNIGTLKKIQHQRYLKKLEENFKLNQDHLKLINSMHFDLELNSDFMFVYVDGKRPFGSTSRSEDALRILGYKKGENEENSKSDYEYIEKLFIELPIAIEYIHKNFKIPQDGQE